MSTREHGNSDPVTRIDPDHPANSKPNHRTSASIRVKRFGKRTRPSKDRSTEDSTPSRESSSSESESSDDYPESSSRTTTLKRFGQKRTKVEPNHPITKQSSKQHSKPPLVDECTAIKLESKRSNAPKDERPFRIKREPKNNQGSRYIEIDTDDESLPPYPGPPLRILSVPALNARLTRSYHKRGINTASIIKLAGWWPKSSVAKHHKFNVDRVFLLTWAVHIWWSNLWNEINMPGYKWPSGWSRTEKRMLMSRIREVALIKEGFALRGERDMISAGKIIPVDSVIQLVR